MLFLLHVIFEHYVYSGRRASIANLEQSVVFAVRQCDDSFFLPGGESRDCIF